MTIQRMIELLQIEHECMLRGSHDGCDRNCADCELVQDDCELHEMYTDVIALLKKQEPIQMKVMEDYISIKFGYCPKCKLFISNRSYPKSCGCGQAVKWE